MPLPPFQLVQGPRHRRTAAGNALPVIILLLALGLSTLVFFRFTRPAMQQRAEAEPPAPVPAPAPPPVTKPQAAATAPQPAAPAKPTPPAPPRFGFARPIDLGKEMVRNLNSGDFARAGKLAAAADPAQSDHAAQMLQKILKDFGAKIGREDQVELLGQNGGQTRIALPLTLPNQKQPLQLQIDLERDEKMGWKVAQLHLPKELASLIELPAVAAMATASTSPDSPPAKNTPAKAQSAPAPKALFSVLEPPDALSFASDFVKALLKHDFAKARQYVDEKKVTPERLIGLCIVFEEGRYELKPAKPLIITIANPEVSWVIAQVQSPSMQQSTEFGLELQRSDARQPWKVVGLNLSEILSSFANSAAQTNGIPYTPIVNNPKGGESLALYFEYDQADLHPRARKQLEIVADLLKSDANRKIQIAGHTDAKGTDSYNLSLSQARAESVKRQLSALGVSPEQIVTTGLGKAQPLSPNRKADGSDDPLGRSQNRRAEIYLDF